MRFYGFLLFLAWLPMELVGAQVAVNVLQGMSFGAMEFAGVAGGPVVLGTNGSLTYPAQLSGNGLGVAGQLQVNAPAGTLLSVACEAEAVVGTGSGSMTIDGLEIVAGAGGATMAGGGLPCAGVDNSTSQLTVSTSASQNIILVGGRLRAQGQPVQGGTYDSQHGAGTPVLFRFVVM